MSENKVSASETSADIIDSSEPHIESDFLTLDTALEQIQQGNGYRVSHNIKLFNPDDRRTIAEALIADGKGEALISWPDHYGPDHNSFAHMLIEAGYAVRVAESVGRYKDLDSLVAAACLDAKQGHLIAKSLSHFKELSDDVAQRLIEEGYVKDVSSSLSSFSGLSEDTAEKILLVNSYPVFRDIPAFSDTVDWNKVFINVLNKEPNALGSWYSSWEDALEHISRLDVSLAHYIARHGGLKTVLKHKNVFENLNEKELVDEMINIGKGWSVLDSVDLLENTDITSVIDTLFARNEGRFVAGRLRTLKLNSAELSERLYASNQPEAIYDNRYEFTNIDEDRLVDAMIATNQENALIDSMYKRLRHPLINQIPAKLITAKKFEKLLNHLDSFNHLDSGIAESFIEHKQLAALATNLDKFPQNSLSEAVLVTLLEAHQQVGVVKHLDKFTKESFTIATAEALLDYYCAEALAGIIDKFKHLPPAVAYDLAAAGFPRRVLVHKASFETFDVNMVLDSIPLSEFTGMGNFLPLMDNIDPKYGISMIKYGQVSINNVVSNLDRFALSTENHSDHFQKQFLELIETYCQQHDFASLVQYKDYFPQQDFPTMLKGMAQEPERRREVVSSLHIFNNRELDASIATALVEQGLIRQVLTYHTAFKDLDYKALAEKLVENRDWRSLAEYTALFPDIDKKVIFEALVDDGRIDDLNSEFESFASVDHTYLFTRLVQIGRRDVIADNISILSDVDSKLFDDLLRVHYPAYRDVLAPFALKSHQVFAISELLVDQEIDPDELLAELEQAPFLVDALVRNPTYGIKLFSHYPTFDAEVSQRNIAFLYEHTAELSANDFYDFQNRQHMQTALSSFENNQRIVNECQDYGIDMETWLNWSNIDTFHLGSLDDVSLRLNHIRTPLSRAASMMPQELQRTARDKVLPFVKDDVIPADLDQRRADLVNKMDKLKGSLASAPVGKQAQMMDALVKMQQSLVDYTPPRAGAVLRGTLDALELLGSKVTNLTEKVDVLKENLNQSSGNNRHALLKELKNVDHELAKNAVVLLERIKYCTTLVERIAADCTGDHGEAITQEIRLVIQEISEHLGEDERTIMQGISNFESGSTHKLDGREITIGIHNRTPDTGLYLGNYTDCCVRIDSEYHIGSAPISDYLTDLGMQLIVAADTTQAEDPKPVAVAWCYLGSRNDTTYLVVDNIEANTSYTDLYKQQFTERMRQYIEELANNLGLPVIQGAHHNDLVVAPLSYANKIGPTNDPREGYYLEAQYPEYDTDDDEDDYDNDFYFDLEQVNELVEKDDEAVMSEAYEHEDIEQIVLKRGSYKLI